MSLTTEDYKGRTITLNEEDNQPVELKINDLIVQFSVFSNGQFHTEIFPYQDFASPMEMAKYIVDNLPGFGLETN